MDVVVCDKCGIYTPFNTSAEEDLCITCRKEIRDEQDKVNK